VNSPKAGRADQAGRDEPRRMHTNVGPTARHPYTFVVAYRNTTIYSVEVPWNRCLVRWASQGASARLVKVSCVKEAKKLFTLLDLCVSSLRRGHANLLCIVPILTDDPRRESKSV